MDEAEIQAARARVLAGGEKREPVRIDEESAYIAHSRANEEPDRRKQRLWGSVSWAGAFTGPLGWLYLFYLWAASSMAMVAILTLAGASGQVMHALLPGGTKVLPIPTTIGAAIFWWWTRSEPARALKQEQAWIQALPFKLSGYEEALS